MHLDVGAVMHVSASVEGSTEGDLCSVVSPRSSPQQRHRDM